MKNSLEQALREVLNSFSAQLPTQELIKPTDLSHGDYTSNVALIVSKQLKRNPLEVAGEIRQKLEAKQVAGIGRIEVVAPGFINFWLSTEELVKRTLEQDIEIENIGQGRKVIVEYSSPNIAKPFTIGHLRSTVIGDAIANLMEVVGYTVYRDNHIGDWGTQFGKQIAALKYIDLETGFLDTSEGVYLEKNINTIELSERPVKLLVDLYIKFHEQAETHPALEDIARAEFRELELTTYEDHPGNKFNNRALWRKCVEWSWKEFDLIYKELNIKFTENKGRGYGEAFFEDKMQPVITELEENGLLSEGKEGAKIVQFPNDQYPPLMIIKKDGATLYATRDLATDKFRIGKYGSDITIINEVGAEQSLQFAQLYKLEEMLGWFKPGQRIHIKHGLYRFKEGKMATRKGNVIWLEDVLRLSSNKAMDFYTKSKWISDLKDITDITKTLTSEETIKRAHQIGIGALKWNDLKRSSHLDVNFDWAEILSMQGNSGPYMQYAYVRTQSIQQKAKVAEKVKIEQNYTEEELSILRALYQFSNVVVNSAVEYSPNTLCTYLYELAQAFNLFYQKHKVIEDGKYLSHRLAIVEKVGEVIKEGLDILGIDAPEKM